MQPTLISGRILLLYNVKIGFVSEYSTTPNNCLKFPAPLFFHGRSVNTRYSNFRKGSQFGSCDKLLCGIEGSLE